jgi:hypothetical protein
MPLKPKALVLDSQAVLAYLGDEASAQAVADLITCTHSEGPQIRPRHRRQGIQTGRWGSQHSLTLMQKVNRPNSRNIVPGETVFSVELRDTEVSVLGRVEQGPRTAAGRIAQEQGLAIDPLAIPASHRPAATLKQAL